MATPDFTRLESAIAHYREIVFAEDPRRYTQEAINGACEGVVSALIGIKMQILNSSSTDPDALAKLDESFIGALQSYFLPTAAPFLGLLVDHLSRSTRRPSGHIDEVRTKLADNLAILKQRLETLPDMREIAAINPADIPQSAADEASVSATGATSASTQAAGSLRRERINFSIALLSSIACCCMVFLAVPPLAALVGIDPSMITVMAFAVAALAAAFVSIAAWKSVADKISLDESFVLLSCSDQTQAQVSGGDLHDPETKAVAPTVPHTKASVLRTLGDEGEGSTPSDPEDEQFRRKL